MTALKLQDLLIIPFGCPEWSLDKLKITGFSTAAIHLESKIPCVCINKGEQTPLRLNNISNVFPESMDWLLLLLDDPKEAFNAIRDFLRGFLQTESQQRFLDLYFRKIENQVTPGESGENKNRRELPVPLNYFEWCFYALMPLPQAHLCVADPDTDEFEYRPGDMIKADFVFWTGRRPVAVIISGKNRPGNRERIKSDLLQKAGVGVVHVQEEELVNKGIRALAELLPKDVNMFWEGLTMDDFLPSPVKFLTKLF